MRLRKTTNDTTTTNAKHRNDGPLNFTDNGNAGASGATTNSGHGAALNCANDPTSSAADAMIDTPTLS